MMDGIMRKLGYINEKKLIDVAIHVYENNDGAKAKDPNSFCYHCGNANAINYIFSKFGVNFSEIIKERRKDHDSQ